MKKLVSVLVLVFCLCMAMPTFAMSIDFPLTWSTPASNEITVQLNGENVDFTDENGNKVVPQIMNDRTMVPMRKIFEEFGTKVEWNASDRSISANKDGLEIWLQIDNTTAKVTKDGKTEQITLDSAPTIVDGRTLVPVRFIAESLDKVVGWDSWDRTVVIIDTSFVEEEIKKKAPNFYAFISDEYEALDTYDMTLAVNTDVDVNQDGEKEKLSIDANGEVKLNEEAISLGGSAKLTGKGEDIEEALKELSGKVEGNLIIDLKNGILYFKSPLLEESGYFNMTDYTKWVKLVMDEEQKAEFDEILKEYQSQSGKVSFKEALDLALTNTSIYTDTYDELKQMVDVIALLCGNDYFTLKENSNRKEYTYHLDKDGLVKIMYEVVKEEGISLSDVEEELKDIEFDLVFKTTVENKVATSSTVDFSMKYKESYTYSWMEPVEEHTTIVNVKANAQANVEQYNEDIKISMPAAKDTVNFDDVYVDPWADMMKRVMFSSFATQLGALTDDVKMEMISEKGKQAVDGNSVTEAQLYNYIVQGYGATMLSNEEAKAISCTRLSNNFVENHTYGSTTKVETEQGEKEVQYYVTPSGNVFCWPPLPYEEKSYVNNEVTVKDSNGNELAGTSATKAGIFTITFANDEKIEITTKADGTYSIKGEYVYTEKEEVVEPISKIYEDATVDWYYVPVYEDHKMTSKRLGSFYDGDIFSAQKYSNGWSRVSSENLSGWAQTEDIEFPE